MKESVKTYYSNLESASEKLWEHCNIRNIDIGSPDFRISFITLNYSHNSEEITHKLSSEIAIIYEGKLKAKINGIEKILSKNDIVYIPKNTKHSFKAISLNVNLLVIHTPHISIENDHLISTTNQNRKG